MKKKDGFTLVEAVVSIAIIMIMGSFVGIGISYLTDKNISKKAELFASEIKMARDMQITLAAKKSYIEFELIDDEIIINRKRSNRDGSDEELLSFYKIDKSYDIKRHESIDIRDDSIVLSPAVGSEILNGDTIEFSSSTGKVINGFGVYVIKSADSQICIKVQKENGRVILYEE